MQLLLGAEHAEQDRRNFFATQLIFWLLAATDGHAKNFSIFLSPGSRFRATPLYAVLSAHPIICNGAGQLAPQHVKLAMAVRGSQNVYLIQQIQRRHWVQHAQRTGLGAATAEHIIEELLARVPDVLASVAAQLPADFPMDLADAILNGVSHQAARLAAMPRGA